jgi:glycerophosphoryl diester phosphodiesterase
MSNAIIKQEGDSSFVADNIWELRLGAGPLLLGLALGSLVTGLVSSRLRRADAPRPRTPTGWPVNFAHRGGAKVVPEDTLEGFRAGIAMGGGVVELDVHVSADGVVVLIHDAEVDRTTDGTGPVAEKTLAELQQLDAGYRFSPDGGATFPWRGKGVTITTLETIYQEFPDRPINIEIKGRRSGIERGVWEVIEAAGAADRTLVVADDLATIKRFRRASRRQVATGASAPELIVDWLLGLARLGRLLEPPYQALQPPETYRGLRIVTPGFLRRAHERGLRVDVWTIDDEPGMRRLLGWGVDGIMTDRPDILAGVLGAR